MITTRNERVVEIMGGMDKVCHLEVLKDEECLSVFAQHALGVDNFDAHQNLKEIGEKIVTRCKGLPLAAKTLGGLLCGKLSHHAWERILKSEIWELQENESYILPALRLSYHYLPSYLKPCFAYCALFPKDHEFEKNQLVLLWMACGVLQQQSVEAGHLYFCKLVSRALFQRSSRDEARYVMHDLVHDLAQFVAGESCFNLKHMFEVDKKSKVNYEKIRYLSFVRGTCDISKKFEVLNAMKRLRTFIPVDGPFSSDIFDGFYLSNIVVHEWLPKLRCLRVLSLEGYKIQKLPDSIGDLKHLKYLNLSETLIESLPESVGFLLKLQTLLLVNCCKFLKFPVAIENLIDLHHLDIRGTDSLKEMPSRIGNLKNLLTLSKFIVGKEDGLMRLSYLKNLSQLRGNLAILNLHNVLNVQDAMEANLQNIDGVVELLLEWTLDFCASRYESNEDMQVLNWLRPHSNLESLTIVSYGGQKFPSWIGDPIFSNLSYLKLSRCRRCTLLPSLGLSPVLRELIIEGMEGIETVGSEFYGHGIFSSLEKLVFRDMLNWKKWSSQSGSGGEFPCLGELVISNCPMLTGQLPSHLPSLAYLRTDICKNLRCLSTISLVPLTKLHIRCCSAVLLKSMVDLTSLTKFLIEYAFIEECKELACLCEEGSETINLACLVELKITESALRVLLRRKEQGLLDLNLKGLALYNCRALESLILPDLMMREVDGSSSSSTNMVRHEELVLLDCPSLKSISLPTTVKLLSIRKCDSLECLPDGILMEDDGDNNSNLENLILSELPSLNSIQRGHLPASLKKLHVGWCVGLESFPKGMLQHCTGLGSIHIQCCRRLKSLPSLDCLSNLVDLNIDRCEALESIPDLGLGFLNLNELTVNDCKNLKSFPNTTMAQLKSLQCLSIKGCPSIELIPFPSGNGGLLLLPNVIALELDDAILKLLLLNKTKEEEQLTSTQKLSNPVPEGHLATMVGWGLHNLTSLKGFEISRIFPLDIVLPSSLTILHIRDVENLESIPRELFQNLNSLEYLAISKCPKLRSCQRKACLPLLEPL